MQDSTTLPPTESAQATVYVGRQPIFDRQRRTHAYQLLHRSTEDNHAGVVDGDEATRTMIDRMVFQWGIDPLLGTYNGFLHVTHSILADGLHRLLPPKRIVLELLDDIDVDDSTRQLAREAKRFGFKIAVDDVVRTEQPVSPDLLAMADVVKVDVSAIEREHLEGTVRTLRSLAPHALLLAEKVEELLDFRTCVSYGFDLFAGYFFARPEVLTRSRREVSTTGTMALLAEVQQPDISLGRLQQLVTGDPTLAFRLLALVNSGEVGLSQRVESVSHALVMLGLDRVRQLATLLAMSTQGVTSSELMALACTRAHMAKALVADPRMETQAQTVGLLSVIDSIFQAPMRELVDALPLAPNVADALRDGSGPLGMLLRAIVAYERGDLGTLERLRPKQLPAFISAFTTATSWAERMRPQLTRV
jgi:c-di-GMP phosphodiesterase